MDGSRKELFSLIDGYHFGGYFSLLQIRRSGPAMLLPWRLDADDVIKGVPPDSVDKVRKMLAFLDDMDEPEE
jgi:hypothetical protein